MKEEAETFGFIKTKTSPIHINRMKDIYNIYIWQKTSMFPQVMKNFYKLLRERWSKEKWAKRLKHVLHRRRNVLGWKSFEKT